MQRVRNFLTAGILAFSLSLTGLFVAPVAVHADTPKQVVCTSIGAGADCASDSNNGVTVNKIIQVTLNILSILVGVTAVIMIMVSGFKYITAGGDASKVSSAKNTLVYAIIGIVVVALAQFIVQFVINKVTVPPTARETEKTNGSLVVPAQVAVTPYNQPYNGFTYKA